MVPCRWMMSAQPCAASGAGSVPAAGRLSPRPSNGAVHEAGVGEPLQSPVAGGAGHRGRTDEFPDRLVGALVESADEHEGGAAEAVVAKASCPIKRAMTVESMSAVAPVSGGVNNRLGAGSAGQVGSVTRQPMPRWMRKWSRAAVEHCSNLGPS